METKADPSLKHKTSKQKWTGETWDKFPYYNMRHFDFNVYMISTQWNKKIEVIQKCVREYVEDDKWTKARAFCISILYVADKRSERVVRDYSESSEIESFNPPTSTHHHVA